MNSSKYELYGCKTLRCYSKGYKINTVVWKKDRYCNQEESPTNKKGEAKG